MKVCPSCARRYPDNALRCPEDGGELVLLTAQTQPEGEDLVGRRMFGNYVIERKLGEGGMGAVYLATNTHIDQSIAIKVLHGRSAESTELVQRFNREAKAIARLTHPNIIRVFIFGHTEDDLMYLVMEYVRGRTLRQLIESRGRLSPLRAIYVAKQVLAALAEAHDLGIIHRDLKPDNILLTEYRGNLDFVKVVDFGIAKVKEPDGAPQQQLTQAGVVYGTPEYLSPEQAQARELDGRSDLYSVGIVLWEMLVGAVPFSGKTAMSVLVQHVYDPPPALSTVSPDIPEPLRAVLQRALAKGAGRRFQTADEFIAALEAAEQALNEAAIAAGVPLDDFHKTEVWVPPPEFNDYLASLAEHQTEAPEPPPGAVTQRVMETNPADYPKTMPVLLKEGAKPPSRARQAVLMAIAVGLFVLVGLGAALLLVLLQR